MADVHISTTKIGRKKIANDNIAYSRAGDAFHYRWAARRCLELIKPNTNLHEIHIEGSKGTGKSEYVIDLSEYYDDKKVVYYQLKHTTLNTTKPFHLSDLKTTIVGFAERFSEHLKAKDATTEYVILTNRPFDKNLKNNLVKLAEGKETNKKFRDTIRRYTKLDWKDLIDFCALLKLQDGEDDCHKQWYNLAYELSQSLTSPADYDLLSGFIQFITDAVISKNKDDCRITKEKVFQRFGVTSAEDLFPAPCEIETLSESEIVKHPQIDEIKNSLLNSQKPVIIHASGGVGKTILSKELVNYLPNNSIGLVYDCFGAGQYRNPSKPRHRAKDFVIQVVNELADKGLCDYLFEPREKSDDSFYRKFLERIQTAITTAKKINPNAKVVIVIDAADNSQIAADEVGTSSFVKDIAKLQLPQGCCVALTCRTERVNLLEVSQKIPLIELKPFEPEQSSKHLRLFFADASDDEALQFHQLTHGNPRVQSAHLRGNYQTLRELLSNLLKTGASVEGQIESIYQKSRDSYPIKSNDSEKIESMCIGLSLLPPMVPIEILAKTSGVDDGYVKSFISEFQGMILLNDSAVQFRDEPVETWFRNKFTADIKTVREYIACLKPLANESLYVSEALPALLLMAGMYEELLAIALSEDFLPDDSSYTSIDRRNVNIYRLQFAFKAAINKNRIFDAIKLSLLAGEETKGDERQSSLIRDNFDIIHTLYGDEKVKDLAYRHKIYGGWQGSEKAYSGALLSFLTNPKGEAMNLIESGFEWLIGHYRKLYNKRKTEETIIYDKEEEVTESDELTFACAKYNLHGLDEVVDYILRWQPAEAVYRVACGFTRFLVDQGNFEAINKFSHLCLNFRDDENIDKINYIVMAISKELMEAGKFLDKEVLELCLYSFSRDYVANLHDGYLNHKKPHVNPGIIAFLEACTKKQLDRDAIIAILRKVLEELSSARFFYSHNLNLQVLCLRTTALLSFLTGNYEGQEKFLSSLKEKNKKEDHDFNAFLSFFHQLFPLYMSRIKSIADERIFEDNEDNKFNDMYSYSHRYKNFADSQKYSVCCDILTFACDDQKEDIALFFTNNIESNVLKFTDISLSLLRRACRNIHVKDFCSNLIFALGQDIERDSSEDTQRIAECYVGLARAIMPDYKDEAREYFNKAIDVVSRYGDDILERWRAVVALAKRASYHETALACNNNGELAYRFARIAELVGANVNVREKHYDRDDSMVACAALSPESAISALSRWRERNIGDYKRQLLSLGIAILEAHKNYSMELISLSPLFCETWGYLGLVETALKYQNAQGYKQQILDISVKFLGWNDDGRETWKKLYEIAQIHDLENKKLSETIEFLNNNPNYKKDRNSSYSGKTQEKNTIDWDSIFNGLCLCERSGLLEAKKRYKELNHYQEKNFWIELLGRVHEGSCVKFLELIASFDEDDEKCVGSYDILDILISIPEKWLKLKSFQSKIDTILETIGEKYYADLSSPWIFSPQWGKTNIPAHWRDKTRDGVIRGTARNLDLMSADIFWDFSNVACHRVSPAEAADLLDFALKRFEKHVENDFGDGEWREELVSPKGIEAALSGYLWSALGSPEMAIRWRTVHSVRLLAQNGCSNIIDNLIEFMEAEKIGTFGDHKFPVYNLHARLYLFIALARISVECPELLKKHSKIFLKYSTLINHALIQKFASDTACAIERKFSGTYTKHELKEIRQATEIKCGVINTNGRILDIDSYWHKNGLIDDGIKYYFGYDFDIYWLEGLGRVFGISEEQTAQIVANTIAKEWGIVNFDDYHSDPRRSLWNSELFYHSHGSYPQIDDYRFYLSYHAMFVAASKMLEKMPVLKLNDYEENEWVAWIEGHSLVRNDGAWISDNRESVPLLADSLENVENLRDVAAEIDDNEFLNSITFNKDGQLWLKVSGYQYESYRHHLSQRVEFSSALIPSQKSIELLNTVASYVNSYEFDLPKYEGNAYPDKGVLMELKGWLYSEHEGIGIDAEDPFAWHLPYPPIMIGKTFFSLLNLYWHPKSRSWLSSKTQEALIYNNSWGVTKEDRDPDTWREGRVLFASVDILKELCSETDCSLVIKTQISRTLEKDKDKYDRKNTPFSVYVLSKEGKIRDLKGYKISFEGESEAHDGY